MNQEKTLSDLADELEYQQMQELGELMIYKSAIHKLADGEWTAGGAFNLGPLKSSLMGEDPRLPKMPEKPTLIDFFNYRFGPSKQHLLQSAALALQNGLSGATRPCGPTGIEGCDAFMKLCLSSSGCESRPAK